jgi:mannose-1-phosphate guanylyltransferase
MGLVIIGITPSYPATGYGYIHVDLGQENKIYPVIRFVEKPDRETAEQFLSSGNYLWNSGIVAGRLSAFVSHIQSFLPKHYDGFSAFKDNLDGQDILPFVKKAYAEIPGISFDKGVLEKSNDIVAIKGDFDWNDIGSLESLAVSLPPDIDGNKVKGDFFSVDTKDCIIYGDKALVTAIGMRNVVIAITDDAVLVCPRDRVQDVKILTERLKNSRYKSLT